MPAETVRSIAIIPARGGSKRIPRKNVKTFCGKPMIAWAIEAAKASGLFDRVIAYTDDPEIAAAAQSWGAECPLARPAELSGDHATTDAVALQAVTDALKLHPDLRHACCIYPTNPFLTGEDIKRGLALLTEKEATTSFPVVRYDFPIEQAFVLEAGRPRPRWPDKIMERSQDLPDHFHDAGMFYWLAARKFLSEGLLFSPDSVAFEVPRDRCQDINTPEDWSRAELKLRLLRDEAKP